MIPNSFNQPIPRLNYVGSRITGYIRNRWIRYRSYSNEQGNLFWFFIKSKLSIEYVADLNFHEETTIHKSAHFSTSALRRFLTITVKNNGRGIAKDCSATLKLIPSATESKGSPSGQEKKLIWENQDHYMTIGAKKGKAKLNIVFSQDDFRNFQFQRKGGYGGYAPEHEKIYAKICTHNSVSYTSMSSSIIGYPDDGLTKGETYFSLFVGTIEGESTEAIIMIKVTENWQDISLEIMDKS